MRCCAALEPPVSSPSSLEAWLQKRGLPAQPLALRSVPRGGRGLVTTAPIPRGTALLRVPESLLLTRQRCLDDTPEPLRPALEALPEWTCLAAFLAQQRAAGDASPWAPYVACLPPAPGGLLSWPQGAAAALLRGTSLAPQAAARLAAVDAAAAALPPQLQGVGAADVRWAYAQLFSRLVRLPGLDDTLALVPWADFVNHSCAAETPHLDWSAAERSVVLRSAGRAYAAGDEVTASYGAKSSGQLLLSYGFAPAAQPGEAELNAANEDATLTLRLRDVADDPAAPLRRQAWQTVVSSRLRGDAAEGPPGAADVDVASSALRAGGGFEPAMLPWARLATAPCADAARAAALAAAAAGQAAAAPPPSRAEDAAAREFVLDAIREALRALDAADAAASAPAKQAAPRGKQRGAAPPPQQPTLDPELVAAAAAVRRVERRVLQRAEFVLRAELRALR